MLLGISNSFSKEMIPQVKKFFCQFCERDFNYLPLINSCTYTLQSNLRGLRSLQHSSQNKSSLLQGTYLAYYWLGTMISCIAFIYLFRRKMKNTEICSSGTKTAAWFRACSQKRITGFSSQLHQVSSRRQISLIICHSEFALMCK